MVVLACEVPIDKAAIAERSFGRRSRKVNAPTPVTTTATSYSSSSCLWTLSSLGHSGPINEFSLPPKRVFDWTTTMNLGPQYVQKLPASAYHTVYSGRGDETVWGKANDERY